MPPPHQSLEHHSKSGTAINPPHMLKLTLHKYTVIHSHTWPQLPKIAIHSGLHFRHPLTAFNVSCYHLKKVILNSNATTFASALVAAFRVKRSVPERVELLKL